MELKGRTALITGAARRIGRAIAVELAGCGCDVAIHYHSSAGDAERTADACRKAGVRAELFSADLADAGAPPRLVQQVLAAFGRLDVLINNASLFEVQTLDGWTAAAWERVLRVNLTAPIALAFEARDALRTAGGRIINLCDAAAARPWPDHLAYCVSKGALETLTRVLARALAPQVNVVGIAPGVAAWPEDYDEATRRRLTQRIPLQRPGSPEDIARAVAFVLREGDYINGSIIPIDGGRHIV
ncbi:Glucose 1-dehydrogenase 2 [Phycisphaerae bacterium RAS1]|nr:Glucose 1-dehydrogenase 2 [Phycisphaerae bacterium RAS1]